MIAAAKTVEFVFPRLGVHQDCAITEQPKGTTPYALNVRGYDVVSGRDVGCHRPAIHDIFGNWGNDTHSIDALASGYIQGAGEAVAMLQNERVHVSTMGSYATFSTLANPGSNNSYTAGSTISIEQAFGYFWLVDGEQALRRIDAYGGAGVTYPTATAGTLPTGSTILALYRGRLLHSGIDSDPYNIYASRSGDVLDYDYAALDAAGAFALNSTVQAGLM
jgi:hypothetical protein